ncbi:hypothetical protein BD779DRAFT_1667638 [Infundibulicybe gibba]|nr:hypothetical protein BD779DRAFT_1667638 [Infundibulicybe gibba]
MISRHNGASINHNPAIVTASFIPNTNCQLPIAPPANAASALDVQPSAPVKCFEDVMATSVLPPPGPAYYAARRELWLKPRSPKQLDRQPEHSTSRQRLEKLLNSPGAVENDDIWDDSIEKIWKGLSAGGRLKRRLPMALIVRPPHCISTSLIPIKIVVDQIKIIHAAWIHDDTWPVGTVVPDSDDTLPSVPPVLAQFYPIITAATDQTSGASTPWAVMHRSDGMLEPDCSSGLVAPAP